MDRRYDQPPLARDRYMYSRPRYEERPPLRDDRYYRRDVAPPPPGRPYSYDRYPPALSSSRRPYPSGPPYPPRPHYTQERRPNYKLQDSRRSFSRKESDRLSHSSKPREDQAQKSRDPGPLIASSTANDKRGDLQSTSGKIEDNDKKAEEDEKSVKKKEKAQQKESSTTSSTPKEEVVSLAVEQVEEDHESMRIDNKTYQKEEFNTKTTITTSIHKEAVISFDSDGEDQIMQADWGNESDDEDFYISRQVQQCNNDNARRDQEEEKEQGEEDEIELLPEFWATHITDKGEKYYYNKITRESMWDKPTKENIAKAKQERKEDEDAKKRAENKNTTSSMDKKDDQKNSIKAADDNGRKNVKDNSAKMDTIDRDNTKKESDIKNSNTCNSTGMKRKQSFEREESHLPKSLADRLKFPKISDSSSDSEPALHHQDSPSITSRKAEIDRERPSTQPPAKRVYHLKNPPPHPAPYEYRPRYGGPPSIPPLPDRYYHHRSSTPPSTPHSNGRHVYIDYHHPPPPPPPHHRSPYRHHPMDYPPLPPPPPPRYYSSRRAEYDRRDAPLPPFSRNSRDYR